MNHSGSPLGDRRDSRNVRAKLAERYGIRYAHFENVRIRPRAACGAAGYFASTAFMQQHSQALESNNLGQTSSWTDPDGSAHSVTPTKTYYIDNSPCRDFRQTVEIDGQIEIMEGQACRQRDGTWKLMP